MVVAHPQNEAQNTAVKAILEALKVPYEVKPDNSESPYDAEFVKKIKRSQQNFEKGNYQVIKTEDLWK